MLPTNTRKHIGFVNYNSLADEHMIKKYNQILGAKN